MIVTALNIFIPPVIAGFLALQAFGTWWHAGLFFLVTWAATGTANGTKDDLERLEQRLARLISQSVPRE